MGKVLSANLLSNNMLRHSSTTTSIHIAKTVLLALISVCLAWSATAQRKTHKEELLLRDGHHISIGGRLGIAGLLIDSRFKGNTMTGYGAAADLAYSYFITTQIGIRTGINICTFGSSYRGSDLVTESSFLDGYRDSKVIYDANFRASTPRANEEFACSYYEIPLQLAWRGDHWYLNSGVKFAIPLKITSTYSYAASKINYIGSHELLNYETLDIEWGNYPAQSGNTEIYSSHAADNVLNPEFLTLSFEGGFRAGCTCGHSWVLGVYFDYSINRVDISTNDPLVRVSQGPRYSHAVSVLNSSVVDHLRLGDYGVKLQYEFSVKQRSNKHGGHAPSAVKFGGGSRLGGF